MLDYDQDSLAERMKQYYEASTFETIRADIPALATERARYHPEAVWEDLRKSSGFKENRIASYLLFPLDMRWLYYEPRGKLLNEKRPEFWENLKNNEFLITVPQPRRVSETRPMFARTLVDLHLHDRGSVCFPRESASGSLVTERTANLSHKAWIAIRNAWEIDGELTGPGASDLVGKLFRTALAVMHSPQYEQDHADALAQDWAHLPIPRDRATASELVDAGEQLAVLLDPAADAAPTVEAIVGQEQARVLAVVARADHRSVLSGDLAVEVSYYGAASGKWLPRPYAAREEQRTCWGKLTGDLAINASVRFMNVPERVWRYELGGYPVLKKWLGYRHKDRRDGRPLSLDELKHFRSMVQRLAAVLVLHDRLDHLYSRASAAAFTAEDLGLRTAP